MQSLFTGKSGHVSISAAAQPATTRRPHSWLPPRKEHFTNRLCNPSQVHVSIFILLEITSAILAKSKRILMTRDHLSTGGSPFCLTHDLKEMKQA